MKRFKVLGAGLIAVAWSTLPVAATQAGSGTWPSGDN